ncbi:MAG: YvcK family protein [Candidatus Aenigmarchaeota archaeon]|nr:YvcK family protein [Candidatus Aenigmarchaeota archaeon]
MKKIVLFGGGSGLAHLLRGLRNTPHNLTAVVTVTDNGGHSGILREQFGIIGIGDARSCLAALADPENPVTKLLSYRFTESEMKGVSLGNLMLVSKIKTEGSLTAALEKLGKLSGARGQVLPVSEEKTDIVAELGDGKILKGEQEIGTRDNSSRVDRLFLDPSAKATEAVIESIKNADFVVLAPGGLSTSTIPILLSEGVKESLKGKKIIYVANITSRSGFTLSMHCAEIEKYAGRKPDVVIANNGTPSDDVLEFYKNSGMDLVTIDNVDGIKIIVKDLVDKTPLGEAQKKDRVRGGGMKDWPHIIKHKPAETAAALLEVIGD